MRPAKKYSNVAISRVGIQLRDVINTSMREKREDGSELSDTAGLQDLAFLTDIFSLCNELKVRLQVRMQNLTGLYDQISAFHLKLRLWLTKLSGETQAYPCLHGLTSSSMSTNVERFVEKLRDPYDEISTRF